MTDTTERLSLPEIEALSRDVLTRAGLSPEAASAAGRAVAMAERGGARSFGLHRLIALVEGIRMGGIDGTAEPRFAEDRAGRLIVDAAGGLADFALECGFDALAGAAARTGAAALVVTGAGDRAHLPVWAERLAEHGLIGVGLPDLGSGCLALPGSSGRAGPAATLPPGPDGAGWIALLVAALTGTAAGAAPPEDLPFDRPLGAGHCLIALRAADGGTGSRSLAELGLSPDAADQAARRHRAETEGVAVPADLLVRIVTA